MIKNVSICVLVIAKSDDLKYERTDNSITQNINLNLL